MNVIRRIHTNNSITYFLAQISPQFLYFINLFEKNKN
jgi:hypothetical protein